MAQVAPWEGDSEKKFKELDDRYQDLRKTYVDQAELVKDSAQKV